MKDLIADKVYEPWNVENFDKRVFPDPMNFLCAETFATDIEAVATFYFQGNHDAEDTKVDENLRLWKKLFIALAQYEFENTGKVPRKTSFVFNHLSVCRQDPKKVTYNESFKDFWNKRLSKENISEKCKMLFYDFCVFPIELVKDIEKSLCSIILHYLKIFPFTDYWESMPEKYLLPQYLADFEKYFEHKIELFRKMEENTTPVLEKIFHFGVSSNKYCRFDYGSFDYEGQNGGWGLGDYPFFLDCKSHAAVFYLFGELASKSYYKRIGNLKTALEKVNEEAGELLELLAGEDE